MRDSRKHCSQTCTLADASTPQLAEPSDRLDLEKREDHHSQQHHAMPKARNLSFTIGPSRIADRQIDRLEIELRGAEDEVEIAERIKIAEVGLAIPKPVVIRTAHHFGAAQGVRVALVQQPGEQV